MYVIVFPSPFRLAGWVWRKCQSELVCNGVRILVKAWSSTHTQVWTAILDGTLDRITIAAITVAGAAWFKP